MIQQVEHNEYSSSGRRLSEQQFYCKIRNSLSSNIYKVHGHFIPNNVSPDSNANRRLDVLRCRMEDSTYAYKYLAKSSSSVMVEILRGETSLINFTVPWDTRRTGYLLSSPPSASRFDAWKGYVSGLKDGYDDVYISSSGFEYPQTGTTILLIYLSINYFLSFHLLHPYLIFSLPFVILS